MASKWDFVQGSYPQLAIVLQDFLKDLPKRPEEAFEDENSFWRYNELKYTLRYASRKPTVVLHAR
jgi:hypothetical protein